MFSLALVRHVRVAPWQRVKSCCGVWDGQALFAGRRHSSSSNNSTQTQQQRLSKVVSMATNVALSRRQTERLIRSGQVTLAGQVVREPSRWVTLPEMATLRLSGKKVQVAPGSSSADNASNATTTRVWLVHKLPGELVADFDPHQRPLLMDRLSRSGMGKTKDGRCHLKPVGRLDTSTEGLMVVTNDGAYARAMELPSSQLHRTYRVRVHGALHTYKLTRIARGLTIEGIRYRGMKIEVEPARRSKATATNQWIKLTCTEGKNRQIRKVLEYLGLKVARLIRIGYGDYQLQTIPPGMAIEVPAKPVEKQKHKGPLWKQSPKPAKVVQDKEVTSRPVEWIRWQ